MSREHSPHLKSFSTAEYNQQPIIFFPLSALYVILVSVPLEKVKFYRIISMVVKCKAYATSTLDLHIHSKTHKVLMEAYTKN